MVRYALLVLVVTVAGRVDLAECRASSQGPARALSHMRSYIQEKFVLARKKMEWVTPKKALLMLVGVPFVYISVSYPLGWMEVRINERLERSYQRQEIFLRGVAAGEKFSVVNQIEAADGFALQMYLNLIVHYVDNGLHRLGRAERVDSESGDLFITRDMGKRIDRAKRRQIRGVMILDHTMQGSVVAFPKDRGHILDPMGIHLFGGTDVIIGIVSGVTSGGYLVIKPFGKKLREESDKFTIGFFAPVYLVRMDDILSSP